MEKLRFDWLVGGRGGYSHPELDSGSIDANMWELLNCHPHPTPPPLNGEGILLTNLLTKKVAFTLAEVLITLGIIGVVAALTIPNVITNYKKKVIVESLKANYSIFSQVVNRAKQEHGDISTWDLKLSNIDFANKYILPYLNAPAKRTDYYRVYSLNDLHSGGPYVYLFWSWNRSSQPIYELSNGTNFTYCYSQNRNWLVIDINGKKGPNRMGTDGFAFIIDKDYNKLIPFGFGASKGQLNADNNSSGCFDGDGWIYYQGGYCAALIIAEGWKIPDGYPLK